MPAVSLKNIVRKYGEKKALDNVSFDCAENSRTVIIGPSGAGKTTCLKLIAGLETADEGSLYIDGRDASSLKPHERNIGMIFQDAALFPHSTVYDNIAYGMHRLGYNKDDIRKMVQETAEHLHIESLLKRYPCSLSAGERQRAGIARAIVRKPGLLLLDEPFANLDARLREELQKEIISLQKEYGMTMLLITHDQSEAVAILKAAGQVGENSVRAYISAGISPGLAESTKKAKAKKKSTSPVPLIDTGELLKSITYVIQEG